MYKQINMDRLIFCMFSHNEYLLQHLCCCFINRLEKKLLSMANEAGQKHISLAVKKNDAKDGSTIADTDTNNDTNTDINAGNETVHTDYSKDNKTIEISNHPTNNTEKSLADSIIHHEIEKTQQK